MKDLLAKAQTLTEALPYIKRTWGRTVVIKYGGAAMTDPALRESVASDIVLMKLVGINPVIVHGGGPEITGYMERLGLPVEFVGGLRVTSSEAMEVVKMVLVGKVNKELVAAINSHGRLAVGISSDVTNLIEDGFVPVIASVGGGQDGSYNINADTVAVEIAAALGSDKVIFLTDVDGLYRDFEDKSSLISALTLNEAEALVAGGGLSSGMIPKVTACTRALRSGVRRAHILNGTVPHALLLEVYTDAGVGTMIADDSTPDDPAALFDNGEGAS